MTSFLFTVLSILIISTVSLVGLVFLSMGETFLKKIMLYLVSFSTGALLGNVFLHLLPEMVEHADDVSQGFLVVLIGMIVSFVIEKFIHWRHCHELDCGGHVHPVGPLVLFGDAAHNVLDGILIATAYLVNIPLGIATTIAVLLHEIPQEFGDFALLIHSGFTKGKALLFNFFSALTAFAGVGIVYLLSTSIEGVEMYLLPLAAGNFLYIAGADLIPELHKETRPSKAALQLVMMLAGIGLMFVISTQMDPHQLEYEQVHVQEDQYSHDQDEEHQEWTGVVEQSVRPAPDISYDYKLHLDVPYYDPLNAMGDLETLSFVLFSEEVDLASYLGEHVQVTGEIEWGYAESRVIRVEGIEKL